jgi:hypothetical protein
MRTRCILPWKRKPKEGDLNLVERFKLGCAGPAPPKDADCRNPDPALDANYNLNMVADDRATRSQVVRPSREFQSHGPTTQRKPHLVLLRTVMFGYDLLRNT